MLLVDDKIYADGHKGIYDNKIKNKSVRYGRNSINNFCDIYMSKNTRTIKPDYPPYMSDVFDLSDEEYSEKMCLYEDLAETIYQDTVCDYEKRYMPKGKNSDMQALLGASYEDMGLRENIPVKQLTYNLSDRYDSDLSAKALDINHDDKIDISEYASFMLMADIMSGKNPSSMKINGTITNKGEEKAAALLKFKYYNMANKIYRGLYETYKLKTEEEEFLSDGNNIIYP